MNNLWRVKNIKYSYLFHKQNAPIKKLICLRLIINFKLAKRIPRKPVNSFEKGLLKSINKP